MTSVTLSFYPCRLIDWWYYIPSQNCFFLFWDVDFCQFHGHAFKVRVLDVLLLYDHSCTVYVCYILSHIILRYSHPRWNCLFAWMFWNRFFILQQKKCKLHCNDLLRHLQVDVHVHNSNHSLCTGDKHSFESDKFSRFPLAKELFGLKKLHLKISHNFSYTIILIKLLLSTHVTKTCSVRKTTNKVEA